MEKSEKNCNHKRMGSGGDAVYGLGLIGSLVYYFQHVSTFWDAIMAIAKSLVWPALLIYKLFTLLKM